MTQTKKRTTTAAAPRNAGHRAPSRSGEPKKVSPIGALILQVLAEKNLTQTDFARLLAGPVAEATRVESVRRLVQKWIRGDNDPSLGYAAKIATALAIDPVEVTAALQDPRAIPPGTSEPDQEAMEFARQAAEALNPDAQRPDIVGPLTHSEITNHFPQFAAESVLIDTVEELKAEEYVRATKKVRLSDWGLRYWWKNSAAIPGVMLEEMLSQSAAIALLAKGKNRNRMVFLAASDIRYRRIVQPGSEVTMEAAIVHLAGSIAHADVVAKVDGHVAVRGRMKLAIH